MSDLLQEFQSFRAGGGITGATGQPPAAPTPAQSPMGSDPLLKEFQSYRSGAITNPTDQARMTHQAANPAVDGTTQENIGIAKRTGIHLNPQTSGFGTVKTPAEPFPDMGKPAPAPMETEGGAALPYPTQRAGKHEPKERKSSSIKDFLDRADIALSNTPPEKITKFKAKYPDGDMVFDEPSGQFLFRKSSKDQYAKFDPGMMESGVEPGDVADIAGELPAAVGAVAGTIRSKGINAAGKVIRDGAHKAFLKMTAGGTAGDLAREGVEAARGFNQEGAGDVAWNAVTTGAIEGGVGAYGGVVLEKAVNVFRGSGILAEAPARASINQGAKEFGATKLMPHQASEYPHITNLGNTAHNTSVNPIIPRQVAQQQADALEILNKLHETSGPSGAGPNRPLPELPQTLRDSLNKYRDHLLRTVEAPRSPTSAQYTGNVIDQGIVDYSTKSAAAVRLQYDALYTKFKPQFDLSEVKLVANEISQGLPAAAKPKETATGVIGPDGKALTKKEPQTVDAAGGYSVEMTSLLDDLNKVLPLLDQQTLKTGKEITPVQQLLAFRTRAYDLKTPKPGDNTPEREMAMAQKLYTALTDSIQNPVFGSKKVMGPDGNVMTSANPEAKTFAESWAAANKMAKDRYELLDSALVVRAARNADPVAVANQLIMPRRVETIQAVKRMFTEAGKPEAWAEVQKHFDSYLIFGRGGVDAVEDEPYRIAKRLNQYDRETLNELIPREKMQAYRYAADKFEALHGSGIEKALEKQTHTTQLVAQLINTKNTASIDELYNLTQGNMNSEVGKSIRRGIIDNIIQNSKVRNKGIDTIDSSALANQIADLEANTASRFLTHDDKRKLKWLQDYTDAVKPSLGEAGQSMQSVETTSGATRGSPSAIHRLLVSRLTSWLFTSKAGEQLFYGASKPNMDPTAIRRMGAAAAMMYRDMTENEGKEDKTQNAQMDRLLSTGGVR